MSDSEKEKRAALEYHLQGRPGKFEISPTKPTMSSTDLSKAYSPGVAWPCLEIVENADHAYQYTAKGNLVGVVSNGSAVLGLGNIGALAGKPVMEGKGLLFKKFADIDVFDIEINESSVDKMVDIVSSLEPTFGGINLEDIKAPECFEIESRLVERMDIPVFHDDQHGTAIIAAAGFLNALEITKRDIGKTKVVFSGAGAAAIACARLFIDLGIKKDNLILCDSRGVVYQGRVEGMNPYKEEFALVTKARSLADAVAGADAFMGVSVKDILSPEMVATMAKEPIIFAMSNPDPEIPPHKVKEVRDDAIVATGRSDYPNQVNNVLGFPFIFRGALDVRARKINKEMKLAAVKALADLAKEEISEEVKMAYGNVDFQFGRSYLIPKPFDARVLTRVAPAVAKAAMETEVARIRIEDLGEYARNLENRLGTTAHFMKGLRDRLGGHVLREKQKVRVVFAEGRNSRILQAVKILQEDSKIEPILLGKKDLIMSRAKSLKIGFSRQPKIISPGDSPHYRAFCQELMTARQRCGMSYGHAEDRMNQENYFGAMMVKKNMADVLISGPTLDYASCLIPIVNVIGTRNGHKAAAIYILVFKNRILFFADCAAQVDPNPEEMSEIAHNTAELFRFIMGKEPRVAFLSFSNFGSNNHAMAKKVKRAVQITKSRYPEMEVDGEMQADVATNKFILDRLFNFHSLSGASDILIFPCLNSSNISYKLLQQLTDAEAIGPVLVPMQSTVNIIQRTASVKEIINMAMLTALLWEEENLIYKKGTL